MELQCKAELPADSILYLGKRSIRIRFIALSSTMLLLTEKPLRAGSAIANVSKSSLEHDVPAFDRNLDVIFYILNKLRVCGVSIRP